MSRLMRMTVLIALGLALVAGLPAMGQETGGAEMRKLMTTIDGYGGETPDAGEAAEILGSERAGENIDLSLDQLITLALRRNLSLVVQRYERSRSILGIKENLGIYDFNVQVDVSARSSTETPNSQLQVPGEGSATINSEGQTANFGTSRLLPFGGTVSAGFDNSRSSTNDQRANFDPTYSSSLGFRFDQPLLRNFGRAVTEQNILVARTNAKVSRETFQTQVETIIQQASDAYWSLVEAIEQLKVAEESLKLAEDLHEMNRIQVEVGTLAPLEMVSSEAGVASRKEDIITRRAQVDDQADQLRRLINLEPGPAWDASLVPVTKPEVAHQPPDLMKAVETALKSRPDVRTRKLQNQNLEVRALAARSQTKPRLDLTAQYGLSGLGGVGEAQVGSETIILDDSIVDVIDEMLKGNTYQWSVGVTFGYPIGNRQARAASAAADMAVDQGEVQLKDLELQVLTEVRSAARALESAAERIESAKVSSRLNLKNYEAEQKRYENGLSTSFEVLQIQENLSEARSREVSAVIAYRRAETAYYRAIGQLLEKHHVELADDGE